jgi:cytolysin-activating lysine-acyltransferase
MQQLQTKISRTRQLPEAADEVPRLLPDDWTSGKMTWLLDVIAPTRQLATLVAGNFRHVVTEGELLVHPRVTASLDPEVLKKMGVVPQKSAADSTEGAG